MFTEGTPLKSDNYPTRNVLEYMLHLMPADSTSADRKAVGAAAHHRCDELGDAYTDIDGNAGKHDFSGAWFTIL